MDTSGMSSTYRISLGRKTHACSNLLTIAHTQHSGTTNIMISASSRRSYHVSTREGLTVPQTASNISQRRPATVPHVPGDSLQSKATWWHPASQWEHRGDDRPSSCGCPTRKMGLICVQAPLSWRAWGSLAYEEHESLSVLSGRRWAVSPATLRSASIRLNTSLVRASKSSRPPSLSIV